MFVLCGGDCNFDIPGDFSSSDWSVRLWPHAASTDATSSTGSSTHTGGSIAGSCYGTARVAGLVASRRQSNVLNNRDLCRILCSYIPGTDTGYFDDRWRLGGENVNAEEGDEEDEAVGEEDDHDDEEEDAEEKDDNDAGQANFFHL